MENEAKGRPEVVFNILTKRANANVTHKGAFAKAELVPPKLQTDWRLGAEKQTV